MPTKPHPRSCHNCKYLGSESDGNYAEFEISWPCCDRVERYQYLKSFPFKKRMSCFRYELQVDICKCFLECNKYAGGVWTERDADILAQLEAREQVYR